MDPNPHFSPTEEAGGIIFRLIASFQDKNQAHRGVGSSGGNRLQCNKQPPAGDWKVLGGAPAPGQREGGLRLNQYFLLETPPLKPTMTRTEASPGTLCVQVCAVIESSIEKACLIKTKEWKEKCNQRDAWLGQRLAFTVPTQKLSLINVGLWRRNGGDSFCLFATLCSPNGPSDFAQLVPRTCLQLPGGVLC